MTLIKVAIWRSTAFVIGMVLAYVTLPIVLFLHELKAEISLTEIRPQHERTCNEALTGAGIDYGGCQSRTISGRECRPWNGLMGINGHNYCRNPNGAEAIWCFAGDDMEIIPEQCKPKADSHANVKNAEAHERMENTRFQIGRNYSDSETVQGSGLFAHMKQHAYISGNDSKNQGKPILGTGNFRSSSSNSANLYHRISRPKWVAFSKNYTLVYIMDESNNMVHKITRDGNIRLITGKEDKARIYESMGVRVDILSGQRMCIVEYADRLIRLMTMDGGLIRVVGVVGGDAKRKKKRNGAQLIIHGGSNGNIFVANSERLTMGTITGNGTVSMDGGRAKPSESKEKSVPYEEKGFKVDEHRRRRVLPEKPVRYVPPMLAANGEIKYGTMWSRLIRSGIPLDTYRANAIRTGTQEVNDENRSSEVGNSLFLGERQRSRQPYEDYDNDTRTKSESKNDTCVTLNFGGRAQGINSCILGIEVLRFLAILLALFSPIYLAVRWIIFVLPILFIDALRFMFLTPRERAVASPLLCFHPRELFIYFKRTLACAGRIYANLASIAAIHKELFLDSVSNTANTISASIIRWAEEEPCSSCVGLRVEAEEKKKAKESDGPIDKGTEASTNGRRASFSLEAKEADADAAIFLEEDDGFVIIKSNLPASSEDTDTDNSRKTLSRRKGTPSTAKLSTAKTLGKKTPLDGRRTKVDGSIGTELHAMRDACAQIRADIAMLQNRKRILRNEMLQLKSKGTTLL